MKKLLLLIVIAALAYGYDQGWDFSLSGPLASTGSEKALQVAFTNQQSDIQVRGEGTVAKILKDDLDGSRHQKFVLKLSSGQTVLISHNIDLAPRIDSLRTGDTVLFFGEYEWNSKGGVIHWTHHDPGGRHIAGWLRHNGQTYQ